MNGNVLEETYVPIEDTGASDADISDAADNGSGFLREIKDGAKQYRKN